MDETKILLPGSFHSFGGKQTKTVTTKPNEYLSGQVKDNTQG